MELFVILAAILASFFSGVYLFESIADLIQKHATKEVISSLVKAIFLSVIGFGGFYFSPSKAWSGHLIENSMYMTILLMIAGVLATAILVKNNDYHISPTRKKNV